MSTPRASLEETGLFTDFYELVMAQGYFEAGRTKERTCFDYFFRQNPFGGGYVIFAGLQDLLDRLERLAFPREALDYLGAIGFHDGFLKYLEDFSFHCTIRSCREGEVVFPAEPIVRVEGPIIEAQMVETLLLNVVNFESLVATKSSRIRRAAGDRKMAEFGLRRAQGAAGIQASRAAIIGGCDSTSNVEAARLYGLAPSGTQAHSWIQSFDSELASFRAYAESFPGQCVLLVDTFDTLHEGVPHAITVAHEMETRGHRLAGIRLDSGDLAYLAKKARQMLDDAGLHYVNIVASNRLDEYIVKSLLDQGAPIDVFGVGTALVTGAPDAALDGVYKLSMAGEKPRMKISENPEKTSLPGLKTLVRCIDTDGSYAADVIALDDEPDPAVIQHPLLPERKASVREYAQEPLHAVVMKDGTRTMDVQPVSDIAQFARERLRRLPEEHRRFENPHVYRVGITPRLLQLRTDLAAASKRSMIDGA